MTTRFNLFDLLQDAALIPKSELTPLFEYAKSFQTTVFDGLLENKSLTEERLLQFFGRHLKVSFEHIDRATVDRNIAHIVPEAYARDNFVLPLFQVGKTLTVAISNPFALNQIEDIELMSGMEINPIFTTKDSIRSLFNYCYSPQDDMDAEKSQVDNLVEMGLKLVGDVGGGEDAIYDLAQEAPIAKLVDTILRQAIDLKASDIHIEPEEKIVKVRFRIDGLLKDIMLPPKKLEPAIISRLKILANLDITEKRKPQDGRMTIGLKDKEIDFRVSTVRTISGEKMVLRILDKGSAFVAIEKLGVSQTDTKKFTNIISSSSGIIIVCGPTGSGKTTTLYSALAKIYSPEKNIITIEDPVEYSLPGINQIPVNAKIGMTFATGLSAIVRQDPDVIMIGEIRDLETAGIAIQAALTGHTVFTTLHTRNAPGALTRLIDMGVAPFLLTSAIVGVIGQRLVRQICPHCKKQVNLDKQGGVRYKAFLAEYEKYMDGDVRIFKGQGCKHCDHTGYRGRIGIFEIMELNEPVRQLVNNRASTEDIRNESIKAGMTTMQQDGFNKIQQGLTSLEELVRVLDL